MFSLEHPCWDRSISSPSVYAAAPALSGAPRHPAPSTARQRHLCVGERWTLTAGSAHSPHPDANLVTKKSRHDVNARPFSGAPDSLREPT